MSSRVLRKLQGGSDLPVPQDTDSPTLSTDELDIRRGGARPKKLNEDSCSESEVKEDDDLGNDSTTRSEMLKRQDTQKKRKRKTRKKKGMSHVPKSTSEDNQEFEAEIDRSVHEINSLLGKPTAASKKEDLSKPLTSSTFVSQMRNMFSIEYKNLNPENEMKKIFGSRVVQAESRHHRTHHHHQRGPGGGRNRAPIKSQRSIIVPKANWPNPGKNNGLSMKFLDSDTDGNQYFCFEHSDRYQSVQQEFFVAVESMNPDFIVQLLNVHPFHIDGLLQLSDICKMGEDTQTATELIERSLFAMESAFHPLFNLAVGTCRLSYKRQVNRALFIALFRHLNFVGARGCHRTALEFCKLLYSLDPEADPSGVLLLIDFFALRAREFKWLTACFELMEPFKNLSQLPNWSYSVALAYFNRAHEGSKDYTKADEWLQKSLIMFPGVLLPLLDKCSIEPVMVDKHSYFMEAQLRESTGLKLLENLYVIRSYHLWKYPEILPWLERNTKVVMSKLDAGDQEIKDCESKRKLRYQGVPLNIYRHIIMSELKDLQSTLPREISSEPVLSFDPLPPKDSISEYERNAKKTVNIEDPSVISNFLRSMLPNYNPADQPAPGRAEAANNENNGSGAGLRNSVNSLYEAMQDLLRDLHLPEIPHHEGADSEDSDDEQDPNWQ